MLTMFLSFSGTAWIPAPTDLEPQRKGGAGLGVCFVSVANSEEAREKIVSVDGEKGSQKDRVGRREG